jgi:sulfonate transport system substrate-binding protein
MCIASRVRTLILLLAAVAATGSPAWAEDLPAKIRFGDVGFGFGQPFGLGTQAIADAKGFIAAEFRDTPVKLEFTYFVNTGPAINEAIANSQLDFASYGAVPNAIGRASGLPTRLLMSYGNTMIFAGARTVLPISSVKDLKGYKVALQKATIIHWSFITSLHQNGLSERDVTLIDLKNADQLAAITAGSVDAIYGPSFFLPLRDQGVVKLIYRSNDQGARANGFGGILVADEFQRKYPDATARVVRGLATSAHWLAQEGNRDEALRIWTRTGVPIEILREEYQGVAFRNAFNPLLDDYFAARYRDVIAFDRQQKLIRSDVDLAQWVAPQYLDAALRALDLASFWPRRNADGEPVADQ